MTLAHFVIVVLTQDVELSRSPASHRYRATSSRPELPGFPRGLSCPNLTPSAAHSDHPQMARNSIGNFWVVSTSDDVPTTISTISTISTINPSTTQHSAYASPFALPLNLVRHLRMCTSVLLKQHPGPLQDLFHDPISHHNRRQKLASMALISMNIGKPTRTTMTTRRSTAAFPRHSLICLNLEAGHRRM